MPKVAQQRAIQFSGVLPTYLAIDMVRFGDINRDKSILMAGIYMLFKNIGIGSLVLDEFKRKSLSIQVFADNWQL